MISTTMELGNYDPYYYGASLISTTMELGKHDQYYYGAR